MIPICCAIGPNQPAFSLHAVNDQDLHQHPDAGENRPVLHTVPSFNVAINSPLNRLLSFFGLAQQAIDAHGASNGRGAAVGPGMDTHQNASQPVLRMPQAAIPEAAGARPDARC